MFNVCDMEGNHLGFVYGQYYYGPRGRRDWLVALCDTPIVNSNINWAKLKSELADHYQSRNIWGKVVDEKLVNIVRAEWDREHSGVIEQKFYPTSNEDFLKYMYFKHRYVFTDCLDLDGLKIDGYVGMEKESFLFYDQDNLLLDAQIDYAVGRVLTTPPLYGIITDFPRIYLSVMGFAEGFILGASLSDYGGRNHTHITTAKIRSGNVESELRFPMQIPLKKGEPVQVYLSEKGHIFAVFFDGAVYMANAAPDDSSPYDFNETDS